MENEQTPDVASDFVRYPFPRFLYYLFKKQFAGVLTIEGLDGKSIQIYFRDGYPTYTDLFVSKDILGRILLERGWITDDAFNQSLTELAKKEKRQGQILLEMGALSAQHLIDGLNIQLRRKLYRVFQFENAPFKIFSSDHLYGIDGEDANVRADPLPVIYHGVRNAFSEQRIDNELAKIQRSILSIPETAEATLARYGLSSDEQALATLLLRGSLSIDQVRRISPMGKLDTSMFIYILWVTEALAVVGTQEVPAVHADAKSGAQAAPTATAEPVRKLPMKRQEAVPEKPKAPVKSRPQSDAAEDLKQRILEHHAKVETQDFFEILGITRSASIDQIRSAYFRLAKEYHPDRTASLGIEDVRPQAEDLFRRINEAHSTLIDTEKRKAYEERREDGAESEEEVRAILEAEFAFQQGTVFFRKKDYSEAKKQFERALSLNPKEGEHVAWLAWTVFHDPSEDRDRTLPKVKQDLLQSVKMSPKSATCQYFLGEIYLALNDRSRAVTCFNRTLEVQPQHVDAQRQIRLIGMRHERELGKKGKKSGFFRGKR